MEKKKFEVPSVKVTNFMCMDVIATSSVDPTPTNPTGGDKFDDPITEGWGGAKVIGSVPGKVSWD